MCTCVRSATSETIRLGLRRVCLNVSQGNGHETDFINDDRVYIMDVYNSAIYPHDQNAKSMDFSYFRFRATGDLSYFR
jgi:histone deacetylase 11